MALAPEISGFGDGDHEEGESGLTVDGGGFGAFPGSVWMFANADGSGSSDELTVAGAWNDIQIAGVEIPATPNNVPGTVYLRVLREDLAWSQGFQFTLSAGGTSTLVGLATESDSALAASVLKAIAVGLVAESDTALAATRLKSLVVGLATEVDSAFAASIIGPITVGLAEETDSALSAVANKAVVVGLTTESDTAHAISGWTKNRTVGLALEIDTALRLVRISGGELVMTGAGVATWTTDITGAPITGSGVVRAAA